MQTQTKHSFMLSIVLRLENPGPADRARLESLVRLLHGLVDDFEIILVDNGSNPESRAFYAEITSPTGLQNIQAYFLVRPVDFDVAAWAGVENSIGDYVMVLQSAADAETTIPLALEQVALGHEVIFLQNETPLETSFLQSAAASAFRYTFRLLSGVNITTDGSRTRLMSKRVITYLLQQPRPSLRYRALPAAAGFSKQTVRYTAPRLNKEGSGFWSRARRAWHMLVGNSVAPIRIASILALLGASLNVVYSLYVLGVALIKTDIQPGWVTLSLQQSGMFFLLSSGLFVVTEYMIQALRWNIDGPPYFVVDEMTSARLDRVERLNVLSQSHQHAATRAEG